ncbi:hypothetical protein P3T27_008181 [Kitasatospora sp. MAA19]|nr:hypothetical protein [Kitasatospora sp. MAA19]
MTADTTTDLPNQPRTGSEPTPHRPATTGTPAPGFPPVLVLDPGALTDQRSASGRSCSCSATRPRSAPATCA